MPGRGEERQLLSLARGKPRFKKSNWEGYARVIVKGDLKNTTLNYDALSCYCGGKGQRSLSV